MPAHTQSAASGTFSPVGFDTPDDAEGFRTDRELDLQNLSDEEQAVVTADEFVIFGRANIEQWDDPEPGDDPIYIEMEALEENLDQLLALENISWQHGDVRVGEPLAEYGLDGPTTVHLDRGESLSFDAGDTLRTQVIREGDPLPDGSGEAREDALWLVANVFGRDDPRGSRLSQTIRLGAYYGDLDGFSVTVDKLDVSPSEEGLVVHDVDFHAVTIGPDDLIKNEGSTFGVVSYEMLFTGAGAGAGTDDAHTAPTAHAVRAEDPGAGDSVREDDFLVRTMKKQIYRKLFGKSREGLATEAIRTAQDDEVGLYQAAAEVAPDEADTGQIADLAAEQLETIHERLEEEADKDRETLAAEVADELGMDKEEVMAIFEELQAAEADDESPPPDPEDDEDDEDDVEEEAVGPEVDPETLAETEAVQEAIGEAVAEQLDDRLDEHLDADAFVTEDALDERIDTLQSDLEEQLEGIGENVAENLSQQMQTGGTPDPAGGNATSEHDLEQEIDDMATDLGAEVN